MFADMFVGRRRELAYLERTYQSRSSAFVPVYGRRRVGKTALIAELLRNKPRALYYGAMQLPREQQLAAFMRAAGAALDHPLLSRVSVASWQEALSMVARELFSPPRRGGSKKGILVLDEYQWIAQSAPELGSVLQQLWDHDWQKSGRVMLVLCGSYVGFMEREVLGGKSPLFGRRTGSIRLGPLRAAEARELHPGMSLEDAARTYFVCGGVPAYHLAFSERRSLAQNIASAFFEPGRLAHEPAFLLREELREVASYYGVLTALAGGVADRMALAKVTGLPAANVSFYLEQLVELGYVRRRYPLTGRRPAKRSVRYVLADALLRFWFRFVEEAEREAVLVGPTRAVQTHIVPELDSYLGRCFEQLCRDTLADLYLAEGVGAAFEAGEYWSRDVQIDVVGVRQDGVIDLGECKWGTVRSLGQLAGELEEKVRAFPNPTGATLVKRGFVRRAPRGRMPYNLVLHTLEDLYAAQAASLEHMASDI